MFTHLLVVCGETPFLVSEVVCAVRADGGKLKAGVGFELLYSVVKLATAGFPLVHTLHVAIPWTFRMGGCEAVKCLLEGRKEPGAWHPGHFHFE